MINCKSFSLNKSYNAFRYLTGYKDCFSGWVLVIVSYINDIGTYMFIYNTDTLWCQVIPMMGKIFRKLFNTY